jgi:hypothetical protein
MSIQMRNSEGVAFVKLPRNGAGRMQKPLINQAPNSRFPSLFRKMNQPFYLPFEVSAKWKP